MASIFTKIINGEIPCYKIAENDNCIAFLDISPRKKGHTLVVPKKEVDQLFDLSDADYSALMQFAKQVATAIKSSVTCKRVGVAVIGLDVPHAHIHLIPLDKSEDMNFGNPPLTVDFEEMKQIAKTISENL